MIVSVHQDNRHLLRIEWKRKWYTNTVLLPRLCLAPKKITVVVDGLIQITLNLGILAPIHYLDDYSLATRTLKVFSYHVLQLDN